MPKTLCRIETDWKGFGRRLRREMAARGLSCRDAGALTGVGGSMISQVCRGQRACGADVYLSICVSFRINPFDFALERDRYIPTSDEQPSATHGGNHAHT